MNPHEPRDRVRVISPVMALALTGVMVVVISGDVWSFREQTDLARELDFDLPWLLPVVLDGLAAALASVTFAASLDGRAAAGARLGTALAVAASAASNLCAAGLRLGVDSPRDHVALTIAAGIPVAANLAWEVILGELRRQVMRRRGMPAPVPIQWPRVIRVVLAPRSTVTRWRRVVLEATDPDPGHVTPVTPVVTPVTPQGHDTTGSQGHHDPQGHVTPPDPMTHRVTTDPDTVTQPDPGHVTHDTSDDPMTPTDPPGRDKVVTPMTPRANTIDPWTKAALATGSTNAEIIRAATTGAPLDAVGVCPRKVSESTIKRAIRRANANRRTA